MLGLGFGVRFRNVCGLSSRLGDRILGSFVGAAPCFG